MESGTLVANALVRHATRTRATDFSEDGKTLGEELVSYVKQQYTKTINGLDWLDDSVRKVALQKLDKLEALIGFPEHVSLYISTRPEDVIGESELTECAEPSQCQRRQ